MSIQDYTTERLFERAVSAEYGVAKWKKEASVMRGAGLAQMERVKELEKFNAGLAQESHVQTERVKELEKINEDHQKLNGDLRMELAAAKDEIERRCVNVDKLESELRQTKSILDVYIKHANRRMQKIDELQSTVKAYQSQCNDLRVESNHRMRKIDDLKGIVKVNADVITRLSGRLNRALQHINQIRKSCDTYEPVEVAEEPVDTGDRPA